MKLGNIAKDRLLAIIRIGYKHILKENRIEYPESYRYNLQALKLLCETHKLEPKYTNEHKKVLNQIDQSVLDELVNG